MAELLAVSDPPVVSQHAYVKASNTDELDQFGVSVALSGDTLVVGARFEDSPGIGVNGVQTGPNNSSSGAAYVFVRSAGVWAQQAYLKASNPDAGDEFGGAVDIDGDTIVVGAEHEDSNALVIDGDEADDSSNSSGAAYVFKRTGSSWAQQAYLKVHNADSNDRFGSSVAIDGDTIVVGATFEDSSAPGVNGDSNLDDAVDSGAAYVFHRDADVWSEQSYVKGSDPEFQDHFGNSVDISGDVMVIGNDDEDSSATQVDGDHTNNSASNAGAAFVFTRSGVNWSQDAYLKASNAESSDGFGASVAVSGTTVLVGAPSEDSNAPGAYGDQGNNTASNAGAVFVFSKDGSDWIHEAYLKASNPGSPDQFGLSVALDGDFALIGAINEDSGSIGINRPADNEDKSDSGAAYMYRRVGAVWIFSDYLKASNTGSANNLGSSVAVSGTTIAVGSLGEGSNATGIDGDQTNTSMAFSGAVYVYGDPCATAPFTDVAAGHAFCAEIEWMKQSGISTGFNDGTYQPAAAVTRQAMSAFMARFADATLSACASDPFSDVPTSHPFCSEIQWMKDEQISEGFEDGTYRPAINVTRQAMSAFMARLAGATLSSCATPPFPDVPTTHPFCEEIQWMKESGISTGFNDGTYRPSIDVTRQAMSAFICRLNNLLNHF